MTLRDGYLLDELEDFHVLNKEFQNIQLSDLKTRFWQRV